MNIQVERKEKFNIISVGEEKLLSSNIKDLKETILNPEYASVKNLIIDLSATKYVDSSGLSAILMGYKTSKARGGKMVLCGCQTAVMSLIKISQLDSILICVPTLEEARDYIMMVELENDITG